jgi:hypothetical protein
MPLHIRVDSVTPGVKVPLAATYPVPKRSKDTTHHPIRETERDFKGVNLIHTAFWTVPSSPLASFCNFFTVEAHRNMSAAGTKWG